MSKTLQQIAEAISAELIGEPQSIFTAVSPLNNATKAHLSFLSNKKFLSQAQASSAGALIVSPSLKDKFEGNLLVMNDPYLGYAKAAQLFDTTPKPKSGISSQAVIAEDADISKDVSIAPFVVIESGAVIEEGVIIESGCFIGQNARIGKNSRLYPNCTIYHEVQIGSNAIIQANVVIGSDGFGYANEKGTWVKIPQIGSVIIGDNVEIGAHTAIDRGALENTEISEGVILDNHIHIAHNVKIGAYTAIAGCTAIAGSTSVGKHCMIAGRVSIIGHLTICDNVHFTSCTYVNKSITEPGSYSSGTTAQTNKEWHKSAIRFKQLDEMSRKIKMLEKEMVQIKKRDNDNE